MNNESMYDYTAKMNIEEKRNFLLGNHPKIDYVFTESKKYLEPGMSVCEIGIGDGYLLRLLSRFGLKSTGVDISNYLIKKFQVIFQEENLKINLLKHDISIPLDYENTFDAIFCLDILEHVKDLEKAIENIKKILKNGGILVATLPWKENLDNNMVICPKCHHKFHRVGHFHSFQSYDDIVKIFGDDFKILVFDFIPPNGLQNIIINLLKKTIFRKKYYKDSLPNFVTTCFIIFKSIKD